MAVEREMNDESKDGIMVTNLDEKTSSHDNEVASSQEDEPEAHMTKAKWLACFALGLSYTTAFQQGACLGAIVKSIDEALGTTQTVQDIPG